MSNFRFTVPQLFFVIGSSLLQQTRHLLFWGILPLHIYHSHLFEPVHFVVYSCNVTQLEILQLRVWTELTARSIYYSWYTPGPLSGSSMCSFHLFLTTYLLSATINNVFAPFLLPASRGLRSRTCVTDIEIVIAPSILNILQQHWPVYDLQIRPQHRYRLKSRWNQKTEPEHSSTFENWFILSVAWQKNYRHR